MKSHVMIWLDVNLFNNRSSSTDKHVCYAASAEVIYFTQDVLHRTLSGLI
jgi:hypothetical protein